MILYLDTSSLVKLYVPEDGSNDVLRLVGRADVVATSVVAFAETRSAFARLRREETYPSQQVDSMRGKFLQDWASILKIRVLRRVYERAGELTDRYPLRGFDALHMASYLEIVGQTPEERVRFSAFDERLNDAVRAERPGAAT